MSRHAAAAPPAPSGILAWVTLHRALFIDVFVEQPLPPVLVWLTPFLILTTPVGPNALPTPWSVIAGTALSIYLLNAIGAGATWLGGRRDLGFGPNTLAQVITAFSATFGTFLLTGVGSNPLSLWHISWRHALVSSGLAAVAALTKCLAGKLRTGQASVTFRVAHNRPRASIPV